MRGYCLVLTAGLAVALAGVVMVARTISARGGVRLPARAAGAAGSGQLAWRYIQTIGITEEPYISGSGLLNHPIGLSSDGSAAWLAEAYGRRLIRLSASGGGAMAQLGRPGLTQGLGEPPVGWLGDVLVEDGDHLWVADGGAHAIYRLHTDGRRSAVIGEPGLAGTDEGHFGSPVGLARDAAGNLYVSDGAPPIGGGGNERVQVFGPTGAHLATIGETGVPGSDSLHFRAPRQIAVDDADRLYVADSGNHRVQVFDVSDPRASRLVTTIGESGVAGSDDSHLKEPWGITVSGGLLYIADSGNCRVQVLQLHSLKYWRTVGGHCGDGPDDLLWPTDVAIDQLGYIYVADYARQRVEQYDRTYARIGAFGGTGRPYMTDDDHLNGPSGAAWAPDGTMVVTEVYGHRVVKMDRYGAIRWQVGEAGMAGSGDSHFSSPADVAIGANGRAYVADAGNDRLRVLEADGKAAATIGGRGSGAAQFRCPQGVAATPDDRVFVADTCNHRVQVLDGEGRFIASLGRGGEPGSSPDAFSSPEDVAVDSTGRVYVADTGNHRVQVFSPNRVLERTIGQTGLSGDTFDRLASPRRLALDEADNLYVADGSNHRVQVFDAQGHYLTTIGGMPGPETGRLRDPRGMAPEPGGMLWVADTENHRLQAYARPTTRWFQANVNGFGDRGNLGVVALAPFAGALYAGTEHRSGSAGQVWQLRAGGTWSPVDLDGFGDPGNATVTHLVEHAGQLYAGTRNPTAGGQVWRSVDASAWEASAGGGFGTAYNESIVRLATYGGALYAGTESSDNGVGAEVWRSPSGDPDSWSRVAQNGFSAGADTRAIVSFETYLDTLYAGTRDPVHGGLVWRTTDGQQWRRVSEAGFGTAANVSVSAMAVFSDTLYAATAADPASSQGIEVWRCTTCDGADWQRVVRTGAGRGMPIGPAALEVFAETPEFRFLYLVAGGPEGLQVWRTSDGLDWEVMGADGLGDSNNEAPLGDNALAVFGGRLHLGTRNAANGGEVWSTAGSNLAYVITPTPGGPTATPEPRVTPPPANALIRYEFFDQWPSIAGVPPGTFHSLTEMAVAANGTVYLLDSGINRVEWLRPDGTWGRPFGGGGHGRDRIVKAGDIAVDDHYGRVYVADWGHEQHQRVVVFDLEGQFLTEWPGIYATGIDVDEAGQVWVADGYLNQIRTFGPDGVETALFVRIPVAEDTPFQGLSDLALVGANTLLVLDGVPIPTMRLGQLRVYQRVGTGYRWRKTFDPMNIGVWSERLGQAHLRLVPISDKECLIPTEFSSGGAFSLFDGQKVVAFRACAPRMDCFSVVGANYRQGLFYGYIGASNSVVQVADVAFRTTTGTWAGQRFQDLGIRPLSSPSRISITADQHVVVATGDDLALYSGDGTAKTVLGTDLHPDVRDTMVLDRTRSLPDGTGAWLWALARRTIGNGAFRQHVVAYGDTPIVRQCLTGTCTLLPAFLPLWKTNLTLLGRGHLSQGVMATAREPTRNQFVVLRWWCLIEGCSYPGFWLTAFSAGGYGRRVEWAAREPGEVYWSDIDAGPDGRVVVLDTLNAQADVFGPNGDLLVGVPVPPDSKRVAVGNRGEVYVLTTGGQIVRLAGDGRVLARFDARPAPPFSPWGVVDLAVDRQDRVYVIDDLSGQVTVFGPKGFSTELLAGDDCRLVADKWASPSDVQLGRPVTVTLTLGGTCGISEPPSDIVLAVRIPGGHRAIGSFGYNVAEWFLNWYERYGGQARHRVGVVGYAESTAVGSALTQDLEVLRTGLRGLIVPASDGASNEAVALAEADKLFDYASPRRRVVVLIGANFLVSESHGAAALAAADDLRSRHTRVLVAWSQGDAWRLAHDPFDVVAVGESLDWLIASAAYGRITEFARPDHWVRTGTLVDRVPPNMDYVLGSASPPATWDPATRSLVWLLTELGSTAPTTYTVRLVPTQAGQWATNTEAMADVVDGWEKNQRVTFRVPRVRVYSGAVPPTDVPTPTDTPSPTPTMVPTATPTPGLVYLPTTLRRPCRAAEKHADVVLVVDTSSSMSEPTTAGGRTKLSAAVAAAAMFVDLLQMPRDQAAVVQFNTDARLVVPLSGDRQVLHDGLDALTQSAGTRIDEGIQVAQAELGGPRRQAENNAVIVLVTDGEPTGVTPEAVVMAADRAKAAGVWLFTVGLGTDIDRELLQRIAVSPSMFFYAPDTTQLEAIYRQIAYAIPCPGE